MRTALTVCLATLALAACSDDGSGTLSEAFCSDLESGASIVGIYGGVRENYDSPGEFADHAFGMAAISCPEQLETNTEFRTFLEQWGINPDA
ncbi:MAG TPA: hypothetical protein VGK49_00940 [Ilumatobacteraceae bacterium]